MSQTGLQPLMPPKHSGLSNRGFDSEHPTTLIMRNPSVLSGTSQQPGRPGNCGGTPATSAWNLRPFAAPLLPQSIAKVDYLGSEPRTKGTMTNGIWEYRVQYELIEPAVMRLRSPLCSVPTISSWVSREVSTSA